MTQPPDDPDEKRLVSPAPYAEEERRYGRQLVTDADRTAWATIVIALAGLLSFCAAILQYVVLSGQLSEMRVSSTQTEKMVEAAQQNIGAGQRAWLGPTDANIDGAPAVGKAVNVSVTYLNTGKEPARNVVGDVRLFTTTPDEELRGMLSTKITEYLNQCIATPDRPAGQVVFPATGFGNLSISSSLAVDQIDDDVINGSKMIIVQGCFAYRSFDQVRHNAYCYYFRGGSTKPEHLNICQGGNYAD